MYLLAALAIAPLTPLVGRFLPFFNAETVLVTVAKAFLLLLILFGFPINLLDLTAFIPADIALLNFEGFLRIAALRVLSIGPTSIVGISPKSGFHNGIGILGSPYCSKSRLA